MSTDQPILIAYDGSAGAGRAIDAAAHLFPGKRAVVVKVWYPTAAATPASLIAIPAAVAAKAQEQLDTESEQQAVATATDGAEAAKRAGLDASGIGLRCQSQAWATICNTADEHDAAAVVLGSRGLSPVKSALLGSVSNGVVHHCSRPVVVVP
jgi:nucleotide-binding universal stress UspA family protein